MRVRFLAVSLAAGALVAGLALAQDKPAEKKKAGGAMDEKAMHEMMMKAATPGDAHKKLEGLVGTWDVKVKMWMDPSQPPQESAGTSTSSWVLGNRFVQEKFEGTFMGQPFSGMGYTGYDNVTKQYVGTWMDTASTGVMTSKGSLSGNTMNANATMSDPMTGKMAKSTMKMTMTDADHHTMEMWGAGPNGKNYKMMEIAYTKKK
jgi:hypothetical protein